MKKIYLFAASIVTFAVVGCNQPQQATTNSTPKVENGDFAGIVYMNSDSLISGYKMYKDLSSEFQIKAEKVQKELNMKASIFETQYKAFQNKIEKGLMTRTEAQNKQVELENEQRVILQYRDEKMRELQEEEMVITNKISENVRIYIEKYNQTKKYKMIMNTSTATNVVIAGDPSLDITKEILDGLNAEYNPIAVDKK